MSASNEALARRAVASEHWRWMRGMRVRNSHCASGTALDGGKDYVIIEGEGATTEGGGRHEFCEYDGSLHSDILPDLDDPATLGCLLALVRGAWGRFDIGTWQDVKGGNQTAVVQVGLFRDFDGLTLTEALVAALEAAP